MEAGVATMDGDMFGGCLTMTESGHAWPSEGIFHLFSNPFGRNVTVTQWNMGVSLIDEFPMAQAPHELLGQVLTRSTNTRAASDIGAARNHFA